MATSPDEAASEVLVCEPCVDDDPSEEGMQNAVLIVAQVRSTALVPQMMNGSGALIAQLLAHR